MELVMSEIAEFKEIKKLTDLIAEAVKPQTIYLFGSFARGEQNYHSDYDFYVVVDNDADTNDLTLKAYRAIRGQRKRPVDVLVGTRHKFEEGKRFALAVERDVMKDGVVVYG